MDSQIEGHLSIIEQCMDMHKKTPSQDAEAALEITKLAFENLKQDVGETTIHGVQAGRVFRALKDTSGRLGLKNALYCLWDPKPGTNKADFSIRFCQPEIPAN